MTSNLYPIQFYPIFKYRIWGGNKLKKILNKDINEPLIGESWEISNVKGEESVVSKGSLKGQTLKSIIETYKGSLVGKKVYDQYQADFPLLIKYIDAKLPLSVQVHPNDALARVRHDSFGKNEMWYIMDAEKKSELVMGFKNGVTIKKYHEAVKNQKIGNLLNTVPVTSGDSYYIPAGQVHAIGAGILLAEIQQSSDVTYRIYDYDRIDSKTNKKRELHLEQALDAIDFENKTSAPISYRVKENDPQSLVQSPCFKTNILKVLNTVQRTYDFADSFFIYMNVGLNEAVFLFEKKEYLLQRGETILIPAAIQSLEIQSKETILLEVFL